MSGHDTALPQRLPGATANPGKLPPDEIAFVVPARRGISSGGDAYNARVASLWRAAGHDVDVIRAEGDWPRPDAAARELLADALLSRPAVLVDGLVGACCPEEVERATRADGRVVLLVHLPLADETGLSAPEGARLEALERRAAHCASLVVATSRTAAVDVRRRHGLEYVAAAPPGTDRTPTSSGSGDGPPQLLMLAAVTPRKNQAGLVAALARVADLPWSARLVGPWPDSLYAERVTAEVAAAGLFGRITLDGPLTAGALERCWEETDLLVLPSLHETFGMVVTEALARGVPAVVSRGTGAVEALAGVPADEVGPVEADALPGALVDAEDPQELAATLRCWLEDQALRAAWRGRAHDARGTLRPWSATAAELWELLGSPRSRA